MTLDDLEARMDVLADEALALAAKIDRGTAEPADELRYETTMRWLGRLCADARAARREGEAR